MRRLYLHDSTFKTTRCILNIIRNNFSRNWLLLLICPHSLGLNSWVKRQQLGFGEKTDWQKNIGLSLTTTKIIMYWLLVPDPKGTGNLGKAPAPTPGCPEVPTVCPAVHVAEQAPPNVVMQAAFVLQPPPPTSYIRVTVIVVSSTVKGVGTLTVPDPSYSITSGKGCSESHAFGGSFWSC